MPPDDGADQLNVFEPAFPVVLVKLVGTPGAFGSVIVVVFKEP